VDNIKIDLGEMVWDGIDWIVQAHDRDKWRALVNVVMNPLGFIKCWEVLSGCTAGDVSSSARLHRVSYLEI
jgi:hypothetical protein